MNYFRSENGITCYSGVFFIIMLFPTWIKYGKHGTSEVKYSFFGIHIYVLVNRFQIYGVILLMEFTKKISNRIMFQPSKLFFPLKVHFFWEFHLFLSLDMSWVFLPFFGLQFFNSQSIVEPDNLYH